MTAASVRRIAAAAGVTPALINYYFGGKEGLREAVIEERLMPMFADLRGRLASAGDDPHAAARAFVQGVHAMVARHPWLPALWVREVLTEGGGLREMLVKVISPDMPRMLAGRFAAARESGSLNKSLDPRLLVVSLVGLTMFPLAAAPIWQRVFDAGEVDAAQLEHHTLALLEQGMGGMNGC